MKTDNLTANIVDEYVNLLGKLPLGHKLDLISKLTESVKANLSDKKSLIKDSLSELKSHQIAEEILEELRSSRLFTRHNQEF